MTEDYTGPETSDMDIVARAAERQRQAAASAGGVPPLAPWLSSSFRPETQSQPALPFDSPVTDDTEPADVDLTAHRTTPERSVVETAPHESLRSSPARQEDAGPVPVQTPALDDAGWFDDDLDAPAPAQRPGMVQRLRDAIAVRMALRRGIPDDGVEIVSGIGATPLHARPRPQPMASAPSPAELSSVAALPPSSPESVPDEDFHYEEFHPVPVVDALPVTRYEEPATTGTTADGTIGDAEEALPGVTVTHPRAPLTNFPQDALRTSVASPLRSERSDTPAGDRALDMDDSTTPVVDRVGQTAGRARAIALAGLAAAAARRPRIDTGRALGALRIDSRTALAGGLVLVLLLLGVLTGKHESRLTGSQVLANTAPPASAPVPAPSTVPTAAAHSAAPAPAPAPPTAAPGGKPLALNNPQTLGSGATGFQVKDIRYGLHPNDYRIVMDMTGGAAGTPSTVIGFSDPTTMVVVLNQVGSTSDTGTLPPGVVTSVTLQPSSTPGQTVYIFKLAHPVTVQATYVGGPTRLVIDLS